MGKFIPKGSFVFQKHKIIMKQVILIPQLTQYKLEMIFFIRVCLFFCQFLRHMRQFILLLYIRFQNNMQEKISYKEHKAIFESIKYEDRPEWIRKMLTLQQKKGQYPTFKAQYSNEGKWKFKNCQHHYYYSMHSKQPSNAILFYFHGLNAHSGGSAYFTGGIAKSCTIDVYGLDFENFGRSSGDQRGLIRSADQLVQQAEQFIQFILGLHKEKKKVYISGLSLGGAICFKLAIRHPQRYDGVIFLSPALRSNKEASPFMKKIGIFMGTLFPTLRLLDQKFTEGTKYDQTELIRSDPYMYTGKIVPGTIKVILQLIDEIQRQWSKFTLPFILIQSGNDKLVCPFQGIDFEKQCKSNDKTVIYFKDMWHAVLLEDQLPEVIEAVSQWLEPRVNK